MANAAVANAMMQHPDVPQDNTSVSSGYQAFLRAQGPPVTLELPLPTPKGRVLASNNPRLQNFESDFQIRKLFFSLGLHSGFGPAPSIEMLLGNIFEYCQKMPISFPLQISLPLKAPVPVSLRSSVPDILDLNPWLASVDNLSWGNNVEASSSTGPRAPRLQLIPSSLATTEEDQHM